MQVTAITIRRKDIERGFPLFYFCSWLLSSGMQINFFQFTFYEATKETGTNLVPRIVSSVCAQAETLQICFFFSAGCTHSYGSWHWWCHKENCRWFLAALEGEGIDLWTSDNRSLSLQLPVSPGRRRWSCVEPFLPAQGEKLGVSKERWLHGEGGWGTRVFFK